MLLNDDITAIVMGALTVEHVWTNCRLVSQSWNAAVLRVLLKIRRVELADTSAVADREGLQRFFRSTPQLEELVLTHKTVAVLTSPRHYIAASGHPNAPQQSFTRMALLPTGVLPLLKNLRVIKVYSQCAVDADGRVVGGCGSDSSDSYEVNDENVPPAAILHNARNRDVEPPKKRPKSGHVTVRATTVLGLPNLYELALHCPFLEVIDSYHQDLCSTDPSTQLGYYGIDSTPRVLEALRDNCPRLQHIGILNTPNKNTERGLAWAKEASFFESVARERADCYARSIFAVIADWASPLKTCVVSVPPPWDDFSMRNCLHLLRRQREADAGEFADIVGTMSRGGRFTGSLVIHIDTVADADEILPRDLARLARCKRALLSVPRVSFL